MSRSRRFVDIRVRRGPPGVVRATPDGKRWAWVRFTTSDGWRPISFEDLFRIVVAIVHCENEKYAHLSQPSEMVGRLFARAIAVADRFRGRVPHPDEVDAAWKDIEREFLIPDREAS